MPIEPIIRPFIGDDAAPQPGLDTISAPSQNVFLIVRGNGDIKIGHFQYSFSTTSYMDAQQKELTQSDSGP